MKSLFKFVLIHEDKFIFFGIGALLVYICYYLVVVFR